MSDPKDTLQYHTITMLTERLAERDAEIDALKAHVERLRDALDDECGGRCNAEYNPCWAKELLLETPAQSLSAHDAAIWNEAADVCADLIYPLEVEEWMGMTKKQHGARACKECAEALRQKAKECSDES